MEEKDYSTAVDVIKEIVVALAKKDNHYKGTITAEFILTKEGPRLVELKPLLGNPLRFTTQIF